MNFAKSGATWRQLAAFANLVLEAAAVECEEEACIRESAGKTHPEKSASRGRCFAAARAAINCVRSIRALKVKP